MPTAVRSTWVDRRILVLIKRTVEATDRFALWTGSSSRPLGDRSPRSTSRTGARFSAGPGTPISTSARPATSGVPSRFSAVRSLLEAIYRALPPTVNDGGRDSVSTARTRPGATFTTTTILGNEFYRLWLDREMIYTCAYFPTPEATLDEAQMAKMDYPRLPQAAPDQGERVIEVGCGWVALALFMARRYGVTVTVYNVSTEQIAMPRVERACPSAWRSSKTTTETPGTSTTRSSRSGCSNTWA